MAFRCFVVLIIEGRRYPWSALHGEEMDAVGDADMVLLLLLLRCFFFGVDDRRACN